MRRRLVHAGAWMLATGASVTVSWFGVHTVLAGTAYDPPRTLPVSDPSASSASSAQPQVSATHRPKPPPSHSTSPSASRSAKPPKGTHGAGDGGGSGTRRPPSASQHPSGSASSGDVRGADVPGGRAVFDMGHYSAKLVSATPEDGWDMQVWKQDTWIRVTFTRGGAESSVFCRWDDGPPRIETYQG